MSLSDGDVLYTPPPPSSGIILINILNILRGYNFNFTSISTTENTILTYHRILEAFKYSYATRTKFGDMDFVDVQDVSTKTYKKLTCQHFSSSFNVKLCKLQEKSDQFLSSYVCVNNLQMMKLSDNLRNFM